jgi:hypothetical protein
MQAGVAGIVDLRNANLSQAQNLTIGGVIQSEKSPNTPKSDG